MFDEFFFFSIKSKELDHIWVAIQTKLHVVYHNQVSHCLVI